MTHRATITLNEDAFAFLKKMGGDNRSAFINDLLLKEKQRRIARDILRANREEAEDTLYREELEEWDITLSDGLADDEV